MTARLNQAPRSFTETNCEKPTKRTIKSMESIAEDLFEGDPDRGARYVTEGAGLRFDYSKHWIDQSVLDALFDILTECEFGGMRGQLFNGERINLTENRSVFHLALRAKSIDEFAIDGVSV